MVRVDEIDNKVRKITITQGEYSVSVLTLGAILQSFKHKDRDVVLGYDDASDYVGCPTCFGEVIGPVANRIANAEFTLDGETFRLEKNDGENNLHSGSKNFGQEMFELAGRSESSVTLALLSSEKGGFPGQHEVMVTYYLTPDGSLTIDYMVTSDRRCPVNVTNHAYFNLDGKGTILSHRLTIPSEEYVAVDDALIPTGIEKVEGTDYDFRRGAMIGERRNGAYDSSFILEKDKSVVLENSDYTLSVHTTAPAVQLYTGQFISGPENGKNGVKVEPFAGLALETGYAPDALHHSEWDQDTTVMGKVWRSTTTYILRRK